MPAVSGELPPLPPCDILVNAAGGNVPGVRMSMKPFEMDARLKEFLLDVDGQLLRYENGIVRALGGSGYDIETAVRDVASRQGGGAAQAWPVQRSRSSSAARPDASRPTNGSSTSSSFTPAWPTM